MVQAGPAVLRVKAHAAIHVFFTPQTSSVPQPRNKGHCFRPEGLGNGALFCLPSRAVSSLWSPSCKSAVLVTSEFSGQETGLRELQGLGMECPHMGFKSLFPLGSGMRRECDQKRKWARDGKRVPLTQ